MLGALCVWAGCAERPSGPVLVAEGGFYAPRFGPEGRTLLVSGPRHERSWVVQLEDGSVRPLAQVDLTATSRARPPAFAHRDRIYVRTRRGLITVGTGDRFFSPVASPDGRRIAFLGLATGVHVYDRATGELSHVGQGTAPAWAPDSRRLAFERTEDDGREVTDSDLWIWQAGDRARLVSETDNGIARRPAWSPDGQVLAFDDGGGAIYLLTLEEGQ